MTPANAIAMNHLDIAEVSIENGKKIDALKSGQDRLILLIEGHGPDSPGVLHKVREHGVSIDALDRKVAIMWRVHAWVLGGIGTGFGVLLKGVIDAISKV